MHAVEEQVDKRCIDDCKKNAFFKTLSEFQLDFYFIREIYTFVISKLLD